MDIWGQGWFSSNGNMKFANLPPPSISMGDEKAAGILSVFGIIKYVLFNTNFSYPK